jgi:hypothetical protein
MNCALSEAASKMPACANVAKIFGFPVIGFKIVKGAGPGAAIQAGGEPRKENQGLYAELRGRHANLTGKLTSSGYL